MTINRLTAGQAANTMHAALAEAEAMYAKCVDRIKQHEEQIANPTHVDPQTGRHVPGAAVDPGSAVNTSQIAYQQHKTLEKLREQLPMLARAVVLARFDVATSPLAPRFPHLQMWRPENILAMVSDLRVVEKIVEVPGPERIVEKIVEVPKPVGFVDRIVEKIVRVSGASGSVEERLRRLLNDYPDGKAVMIPRAQLEGILR